MKFIQVPWQSEPNINPPRVDWNSGLSKNLLFIGPVGNGRVDAVTGRPGIALDATASSTTAMSKKGGGIAHESNNNTDGGLRWADNPHIRDRLSGTGELTMMFIGEIDSTVASYQSIISIPYALSNPWSAPYHSCSFIRESTTTQGRFQGQNTSTYVAQNSSTGFWEFDGSFHQYAVTKNGTAYNFYKDGELFSNHTGSGNTVVATTYQPHIFSRNNTADAEGTNGRCLLAAIWKRELGAAVIKEMWENPWQIFEPRTIWIPTATAAAGSTPIHFRRHVGFSYG